MSAPMVVSMCSSYLSFDFGWGDWTRANTKTGAYSRQFLERAFERNPFRTAPTRLGTYYLELVYFFIFQGRNE